MKDSKEKLYIYINKKYKDLKKKKNKIHKQKKIENGCASKV